MAEQLTSTATGRFFIVREGRFAVKVWNCGRIRTAWFSTTLQLHLLLHQSRNFRLLKMWLWSPSLFTLLILLHMISPCFWEWSPSYETIIGRMSPKFRSNHWPSYMQFQKGQFQSCFQQWLYCWSHCLNMQGTLDIEGTTWNITKVRIHFIIHSVQNFGIHPCVKNSSTGMGNWHLTNPILN
jgi:hypothetical protein